ncbi:hypothetical protein B0F90DRAFT_517427 [Multifurca ochricompacta]|uniref:RING-type domain-containing protein n=1 Tax=Multifurca ochricompacta TaxID=376703 RepID=A0AAD4MBN8_9AGAM|nr:hypothetical protein B0F90DRAFT_517427 [Multifurca ochricompacta]
MNDAHALALPHCHCLTRTMSTSDILDPIVVNALTSLDLLPFEDIPSLDDPCPICLMPFRAVLDYQHGKTVLGVARVAGCGHLFCAEEWVSFPCFTKYLIYPLALSLSEWIKCRHGTCPTCRHEFLPELRPVDSDTESSDGGEYIPTEYDADSDFDTDYEDGFMDTDGIDVETMDIELPYPTHGDEVTNADEHSPLAPSQYRVEYHDPHEQEAQSVCDSEGAWWDGNVDGEQEWGLTDGDSMSTSEGELSFGGRFSEANVQVRLNSEGEYTIYEDDGEPKS